MFEYTIDATRSKFKKKTSEYTRDSVLEIIDVEEALKKNKKIEKIPEEQFLYWDCRQEQESKNSKDKLINNSHNINVHDVFKEIAQNSKSSQYELLDYIGRGSFGVVVSAFDKRLKKKIAIKIIQKHKCGSISQQCLEREVSIQSGVKHKHLIELYSVIELRDYICLLMEMCEGGSLKDFICERYYNNTTNVFIKDEECAIIIKRIIKGLDYMYGHNIIHRDIKPGNLYLIC